VLRRVLAGMLALVVCALLGAVAPQSPDPAALLREAARLAGAGDHEGSARALREAAAAFETLAVKAAGPRQKALKDAAAELRARAEAPSATPLPLDRYLRLLAPALDFQGSYTETKVQEPAYGGHASAMGPPMPAVSSSQDLKPGEAAPATFEEVVPGLPTKSYCGGRSKDHILESGGSGIALFDYDGDGLLDIYVVSAYELDDQRRKVPHRNALYHNLGGLKFEDVSKKAGVDAAAWGNGVCVGDFDGDGRLDLYVTNWGPNFLFHNNGDGTFSEVAAAAGVQGSGWSTGCTFFDADGDGDLDLYVARYVSTTWDELAKAQRTLGWRGGPKVMIGPAGLPGEADLFFENKGNGTFVESAAAHGLADSARAYGFGVLATDYDGDGWVDLFVANDSNPNFLYHNRGNGSFESVGLASGVALNAEGRAQAGMGVDAGDYDGDGRLDLVLTTFAHDTKTIFHNLDGGQFEDASRATGLAARTFERMGWGVAFLDADLDGVLDLFLANGHIYPNVDEFPDLKETFRQTNQLLMGDGKGFRDVSDAAGGGLRIRKVHRGLAVGDLDNDGDLDVVVSAMDDTPSILENRQHTGHHWLGLDLRCQGRNPFCIGARVTIDAGGRRQIREVRSGGSYLSQSDLRAHFGLGSFAGPVDVEVQMPGRKRWRFKSVAPDRYTRLVLREEEKLP
jgi:hypothetical protein